MLVEVPKYKLSLIHISEPTRQAGMHIFTLGPLPTNGLAMLTKQMRANMGIMITASHNTYHDNGLKLFGPDGLKLSDKIEKKNREVNWLKNYKKPV